MGDIHMYKQKFCSAGELVARQQYKELYQLTHRICIVHVTHYRLFVDYYNPIGGTPLDCFVSCWCIGVLLYTIIIWLLDLLQVNPTVSGSDDGYFSKGVNRM